MPYFQQAFTYTLKEKLFHLGYTYTVCLYDTRFVKLSLKLILGIDFTIYI